MVNAAKAYTMLGNADLWQIAQSCHALLTTAGIPHCVVGGVAVCLHGYQRNTRDIDILIRPEDQEALRQQLEVSGPTGNVAGREFRSESGIAVQVLLSGDRAGRGSTVRLPDPGMPENV